MTCTNLPPPLAHMVVQFCKHRIDPGCATVRSALGSGHGIFDLAGRIVGDDDAEGLDEIYALKQ